MFWNSASAPYSGVVTDGFGSGSSPAAYVTDPLTGFVAAGKEMDPPVAIDGFFSDDPTEGNIFGEIGPMSALDTKLMTAEAAFVVVSAVAMEGYDRPDLEVSRATLENFGHFVLEPQLKPIAPTASQQRQQSHSVCRQQAPQHDRRRRSSGSCRHVAVELA
jgi:hypothetical protein